MVVSLLILAGVCLPGENLFQAPDSPYPVEPEALSYPVPAGTSVLVWSQDTGTVLFAASADRLLAPASLTKMVTMALIFEHLERQGIAPESLIRIPPEASAARAPAGSSLMFLEPGQRVSWDELLQGLAVASGNDAAMAGALNVAPTLDAFTGEMNRLARAQGLAQTRFVEASGYSPENLTSAREFGRFTAWYLQRWPQALRYHGQRLFAFPQAHNLASGSPSKGPVVQYNRNRLLATRPGAKGLKTGHIPEVGYNLAFLAEVKSMQVAGIILGAASEAARLKLAEDILDTVGKDYALVELTAPGSWPVTLYGHEPRSVQIESPRLRSTLPVARLGRVRPEVVLADAYRGKIGEGVVLGEARWYDGETLLASSPIRVDRPVQAANPWYAAMEGIYLEFRRWTGMSLPKELQ